MSSIPNPLGIKTSHEIASTANVPTKKTIDKVERKPQGDPKKQFETGIEDESKTVQSKVTKERVKSEVAKKLPSLLDLASTAAPFKKKKLSKAKGGNFPKGTEVQTGRTLASTETNEAPKTVQTPVQVPVQAKTSTPQPIAQHHPLDSSRKTEAPKQAKKINPGNDEAGEKPVAASQGPVEAIQTPMRLATPTPIAPPPPPMMKEMIEKMVSAMTSLKTGGQTTTTIVLGKANIFNGVEITITSFENLKGQFTVSFNKLSHEAYQLMNMTENQSSLANALKSHNFTAQISLHSDEQDGQIAQTEEKPFTKTQAEDHHKKEQDNERDPEEWQE
jgi:hypothetical protein